MALSDPQFWVALMQIIGVNIVLSGDNAIVIALACRSLPLHQQKKGIFYGSAGAIILRVILTMFAIYLLTLPYLKLAGSALLLWIAVKLLLPENKSEDDVYGGENLVAAIKTIIIADFVMSLDNVIGVAAAAKGNVTLLIIGLLISIPLIIFGSTLILRLMQRFPVIITLGGALLGWVAGDMGVTDPVLVAWVDANMPALHWLAPIAGAAGVVAAGKWLGRRKLARSETLEHAKIPAPTLPQEKTKSQAL